MRVLMLEEVDHLDNAQTAGLIAGDEAAVLELVEERPDFHGIKRQELTLDLLRSILQSTFAIGEHPEARKDVACPDRALREILVRIQARLDVS
jgi:hypothetical protein